MFRITNVVGSVNASPISNLHGYNSVSKAAPLNIDLTNTLGYGLGQLVWKVYDRFSKFFLRGNDETKSKIALNTDFKIEPFINRERRFVQQVNQWPGAFNLVTLNGTNGFTIPGIVAGEELGYSVSSAGDFNGDGKADLVMGAPNASPGGLSAAGNSYIMFGQAHWPSVFDLTALNGTNGFSIPGLSAGDQLGYSVNSAGDFNGDGISDLIITSPGGHSLAGNAFILFGHVSNFSATFNLNSLNGINGISIPGLSAGDQLGSSVSSAGDVNGDGIADLFLGAPGASPGGRASTGSAYVLFGSKASLPAVFNLTSLNGTNGFSIKGVNAGDYLGSSVSSAGDVNGDGISDLVLGAYGASRGGLTSVGAAYVLFGQRSSWPAVFDLTTLNGVNGFSIGGLNAGDYFGSSVSTAGDINNDGYSDLVFGASQASSGGHSYSGSAYLIFGQSATFPIAFNLTFINGTNGFIVPGLNAGDNLGSTVNSAGDLNNDGISDFVLGADHVSQGGLTNTGNSYILFGQAGYWRTILNLNLINGTNGFSVPGIAANDNLGRSVNSAGDINGDGISDLVLGASGGNSQEGAIFVLFGMNSLSMGIPAPITSKSGFNPSPMNIVNIPSPVSIVNSPISQATTTATYSPPVSIVNSPMSQMTTTTSNPPPINIMNSPMSLTSTGASNPPPVSSSNFPTPQSLFSSTSSTSSKGTTAMTPIPNDATSDTLGRMIPIVPLVLGILRR